MQHSAPERGFVSDRQADDWKDALITGNGTIGAMVLGGVAEETIVLSHAGLFLPLHPPLPPPPQGTALGQLRRLCEDGLFQEAAERVVDLSQEAGYGAKRWTDPFVPAVDLRLTLCGLGEIGNYQRSVDYATALTTTDWKDGQGASYRRRCFVSRADNVLVVTLSTTASSGLHGRIAFGGRPVTSPGGWAGAAIEQSGLCHFEFASSDGHLTATQRFTNQWHGSLRGSFAAAKLYVAGEVAPTGDASYELSGEREMLLLIGLSLWKADDAEDQPPFNRLTHQLRDLPADFDTLLDRSAKPHGKMFLRTRLSLADEGDSQRWEPIESLLDETKHAQKPPLALIEKQFDAGRYAILCSSGLLPPNLQGIWAGSWGAPWSGDYTQNGNLQTAIAANLSTDLIECMEPYFRYLERQLPDYRQNAQRLFGTRGIHVPSRTSSHGLNNHFDATWPMTFWTAGAAWAAHFFFDYYQFTGDESFLRERAFPFMREAALFYEDFLQPGADGSLHFSPSYSPENHPSNSTSQACIGRSHGRRRGQAVAA